MKKYVNATFLLTEDYQNLTKWLVNFYYLFVCSIASYFGHFINESLAIALEPRRSYSPLPSSHD
jgi:hypothetical protein